MKRLAALLLAAALTAGLCACNKTPGSENATEKAAIVQEVSSTNKELVKANFDKAVAFVESAIDTKDMTAGDNEDEFCMYRDWSYEETENTELPDTIEVNGKTITIGKTTVKDLNELGMKLEKSMEKVPPQTGTAVNLIDDSKTFLLNVDNGTDKTLDIDDMTITGFTTGFKDYTLPYSYSGINYDSTVEDVISKLGKPNSNITVDANDQSATITINYINDVTEGKTVTTDNVSVAFNYDPAKDTAALSSLNYSRNTGVITDEPVSEAASESVTEK